MPEPHRRFLIGLKRGEPDWALLGVPGTEDLPAVKWKQRNLEQLPAARRAQLVDSLEKVLFPS